MGQPRIDELTGKAIQKEGRRRLSRLPVIRRTFVHGPINRSRRLPLEDQDLSQPNDTGSLTRRAQLFRLSRGLVARSGVFLSNRYALHCGTENGRGIEGDCVSERVEVGSPPDETSALLMAGMLKEAGAATDERQGDGFGAPDPLYPLPRHVLISESALVEARRLLKYTIGLGSW